MEQIVDVPSLRLVPHERSNNAQWSRLLTVGWLRFFKGMVEVSSGGPHHTFSCRSAAWIATAGTATGRQVEKVENGNGTVVAERAHHTRE